MFPTRLLLLLLAAVSSGILCIELSQPGSTVVTSGQSMSLICTVSGYSLTDGSYCTAWIIQPAGKTLEWIGYICGGGSTYYSDKHKSKFQITRDTSSSTVTLRGQNLQTADTAVYYCARYKWGVFDYWGKGTMVTVSSGGQSAPTSLFAVSQCEASSDGFLTLGCVTSGFSPAASLQFSWTGDVTEQVQYPAVQNDDGKFTAVSHARVKASDWNAEKQFICQVQHAGSSTPKKQTLKKPVVQDLAPSLLLTTPSQADLNNGVASFICVAKQFSPKQYSFNWTLDNKEVNDRVKQTILTEEKSTSIMYTAVSVLELTADEWMNSVSSVNCEFEHKTGALNKEAKYAAQFSLKINPPPDKELFVNKKAVIDCVVTGDNKKEVSGAVVSWTVGSKSPKSSPTVTDGKETRAPFTRTSRLSIDETDWFKGDEVVCSTSAKQKTITDKIKVNKGGERPSVLFYKPEKSVSDTEMVSLVCEVSSSDLGDAYVMWEINKSYEDGNSMKTIKSKENKVVILSYLTVTGKQYNNDNIACAVKDANNITPLKIHTSTTRFSLKINPPPAKELFVNKTAVIDCVVTGDKEDVNGAVVSWTVGGKSPQNIPTVTDGKETKAPFTRTSRLSIDEEDWFKGDEVVCSTSAKQKTISEKIKVKKGGERPSVVFYKPEKSVSDTEMVSLVCEVSSSDLGDAYVMWEINKSYDGNSMNTFKSKENKVVILSYLTVTGKQYNNDNIACAVKDANNITPLMIYTSTIEPKQASTLLLTTPTQADISNGVATFICVASQFSPKQHSFIWTLDNKKINDQVKQNILTEEASTFTNYTAVSVLEIKAEEWINSVSSIKCEFVHKTGTLTKEAKYAGESDCETIDFQIIPPSTEDMLVKGGGDLECIAKGGKGFENIRWTHNGQIIAGIVNGTPEDTSLKVVAAINYNDWSRGAEYYCEVAHKNLPLLTEKRKYSRNNGLGDFKRCPTVYLLAPPENTDEEVVTLTCYVKHFYPKEVVVYWLANDEKLNNTEEYEQRTTNPIEIEQNRLYSVFSQLVISADEWKRGTMFSCLVYHEAINPTVRTIARSIDNVSYKPTLVSITMNNPSSCMAP